MPRHVKVRTLGIGGATVPVTSFADTWIGADRPPFMGNNWFLQATQANGVVGSDWAAQINIGASGLVYGNTVGNFNTMGVQIFPSLVDRAAIVAKSQTSGLFSQCTFVSRPAAGVNCAFGPGVLFNPGDSSSYVLQINSANTNTVLFRCNSNGSFTAIRANCFTNAPGDVCRIEARIVGGFPELRVYQNGTLKSTDTDNSGLGPTAGQFGAMFQGVFTGQCVFSNYSGGVL